VDYLGHGPRLEADKDGTRPRRSIIAKHQHDCTFSLRIGRPCSLHFLTARRTALAFPPGRRLSLHEAAPAFAVLCDRASLAALASRGPRLNCGDGDKHRILRLPCHEEDLRRHLRLQPAFRVLDVDQSLLEHHII
jgi:hypothetical protein